MFFFFNDTAPTEIYTLSLHDALPILIGGARQRRSSRVRSGGCPRSRARTPQDRKSTRLNSSHDQRSYAVFCLKKNIFHNRTDQLTLLGNRRRITLIQSHKYRAHISVE